MQMVLPSGSKIIAMRQTGVAMGSMQNFTFSFSMRNGGVEIFHFQRAGAAVELDDVADRLAAADDRKLWRGAGADGGADAMA